MQDKFLTSYFSTGTPLHMEESDARYDGGDYGLNYLIPKPVSFPIDNSYCGQSMKPAEVGFLDTLFPCVNACSGQTGQQAKDCLNACRGKGMTRSQRKELEATTQAEIAAALKQITSDTGTTAPASNNTMMYVVIGLILLLLLGVGGYFLLKKPTAPAA